MDSASGRRVVVSGAGILSSVGSGREAFWDGLERGTKRSQPDRAGRRRRDNSLRDRRSRRRPNPAARGEADGQGGSPRGRRGVSGARGRGFASDRSGTDRRGGRERSRRRRHAPSLVRRVLPAWRRPREPIHGPVGAHQLAGGCGRADPRSAWTVVHRRHRLRGRHRRDRACRLADPVRRVPMRCWQAARRLPCRPSSSPPTGSSARSRRAHGLPKRRPGRSIVPETASSSARAPGSCSSRSESVRSNEAHGSWPRSSAMRATATQGTSPSPTRPGEGPAAAIRLAMADGAVEPASVGYVNAHATSTPLGDLAEARAIIVAGLGRAAVSSTKSLHGHTLGAAGGIEAIAALMPLVRDRLPPSWNLDNPDTEPALDHVTTRRTAPRRRDRVELLRIRGS